MLARFGAALLILGAAGCLSTDALPRDRAFTKDWASQLERDREYKARKEYAGANTRGQTQIGIGGKSGLSAGVDTKSGDTGAASANRRGDTQGVNVKYGLQW